MRPQFVALGLATLLLTVETATVLQAPLPSAQASSAFAAIEPAQTKQTKPAPPRSGKFVSAEHPTQGMARIVNRDGKQILEFDGAFKTDAGPDLVVALHRSSNVLAGTVPPAYPLKEGEYVVIAPLKKTSGTQMYTLPSNLKLENYKSVVIWCQRFNATFGVATLGQ